MIKNLAVSVGVSLAVVLVAFLFFLPVQQPAPQGAAGTEHYNQENLYGGVAIGGSGNNTAILSRSCNTATVNFPSVAGTNGSVTSSISATDTPLSGAVLGDLCTAGLTTASTSNAVVLCSVTGAATATVDMVNISGSALDLGTGTLKTCYTH